MTITEAHNVKQLIMKYAFYERNHTAVITEGMNNADVLSITSSKYAVEFEIKVSRADLNKEFAAIKYATMTMKENKSFGPPDKSPEQAQLNLKLANLKKKSGAWSKISKHEEYLDPQKYLDKHKGYSTYWSYRYVPNYFYMVVPNKLVSCAIENLKGTGYGVIAYDGCRQEGQHYGYFKDGKWYERHDNKPEGVIWQRGIACSSDCQLEVTVKQKAKRIHSAKIDDRIIMKVLSRACSENISMLEEIVYLKKKD